MGVYTKTRKVIIQALERLVGSPMEVVVYSVMLPVMAVYFRFQVVLYAKAGLGFDFLKDPGPWSPEFPWLRG